MEKPPPPPLFFFFFKRSETSPCILTLFLLLLFSFFLLLLHWLTPFQPLLFLRVAGGSAYGERPPSGAACDYSSGRWVWDGTRRAECYSEDCPFLDPGFRCRNNGRPDSGYLYWRWQPHGCDLPKFNASELLERSRNGKIIFVGDSIGRNQWESLVCLLAKAAVNQSSIYEKYGSPITKHKGFLSIVFRDHNLTVEYYRAPFLAAVGRPPPASPSQVRSAIHLDALNWQSKRWVDADVLVLNAGHWWNQKKTTGSNGTWDEGGTCSTYTEPERSSSASGPEPWNNWIIGEAVEWMKSGGKKARVLNITHLTELRRDGHPSKHREPGTPANSPEDCSHWCLPGVPDTWNHLLYAHLLSMNYDTRKNV
ncbi:hypothetical protein ZIOFF_014579 [Zingiber officinale]|uniref:Trichome birefringence-like N-terminal domain-containing protein n=1 Tax=Zingiber officinale TaxID=94328 RepID=A0A8J5HTC7_ZINOF|nr:hypothetical protein ZIOFF_014579 [Zingiber officinale]